jgi:putative ABC transport system permease protein
MLKNYLKIALAVLRRRKFFTFISLFGISFTLTILLVLTAFIDKVVGDTYPDAKRDRSLYITTIEETNNTGGMSSGALSFYFLDHYAGSLKTPVKVGISSRFNGTNTYINNKKIAVNYKYTNAAYWDIMEYDFLEGKPFTKQQTDNADKVAVISEDMKNEYFGDVPSVIGKYIEADNVKYRVIGVVKNEPITSYMTYSDIYLPYTVSKTDYKDKSYHGSYLGVLLAASSADVPKMQQEYEQMMHRVPLEDKQYTRQVSHAEPYIAAYVNTGNEKQSGVILVLTVIVVFVFIFMLLPTLNLVNINITRIMERSSEIGVRKAFGASSRTLVYQFIVENIILTLMGGAIGLVLSFIVIQIINSANLIAHLELSINFMVLFVGLLICLIFGLLSGVYPAWRMSKLNVVTALKSQ